jgi:hypothetical protein
MIEKISTVLEHKTALLQELEVYVKDNNIPLDDRWKAFSYAGMNNLLKHEAWIEHFEGEVEEFFDDLDFTRYQLISPNSFINNIDENNFDNEGAREDFEDNIKEQWMKKFIWSFKFDW